MPQLCLVVSGALLWATGSAAQTPRGTGTVARPPASTAARRPAPARRAAPAPLKATEPTDAGALNRDLAALLARATTAGQWGVMVVSLTRGDTLFSRSPDALLLPASTMKLYTAAVALDRFGPAHQFRTEILRDGHVASDGTLIGNLYLKGAGDPSLSPRYSTWNDGVSPMNAIADLVWKAGVRRVTGDIIGDASAFEDRRVPEGWRTRYLQAGYAARVSALSVNENLAHIVVRATAGGATVQFQEALYGLPIQSTVTVRRGSRGAMIRIWQDTTANRFRVNGWIGALSPERRYQVVVEQPERFAAAFFRAALERRGIVVDGGLGVQPAPPEAAPLTAWRSPPLAQLLVTMNGESNNHFAELLFRNASRADGGTGAGSASASNAALRAFLTSRVGTSPDAVFAADGSGLSTLDRVTPRSMVQLLGYARTAPWGQVFAATLPVAGRTETLRGRMRGTPAEDNLHAKTGTTNEVTSLGGYVRTRSGELLAFSFLYNGHERGRARAAIDAMGATLAGSSR